MNNPVNVPRPYPVPVKVHHEKHIHVIPQTVHAQSVGSNGVYYGYNGPNNAGGFGSLSSLLGLEGLGRVLGLSGPDGGRATVIKHIDLTNHHVHWAPSSHHAHHAHHVYNAWAPSSGSW